MTEIIISLDAKYCINDRMRAKRKKRLREMTKMNMMQFTGLVLFFSGLLFSLLSLGFDSLFGEILFYSACSITIIGFIILHYLYTKWCEEGISPGAK